MARNIVGRLGGRGVPLVGRHQFRLSGVFEVLWRHDLYTVAVEHILYVGVQRAEQHGSGPWLGGNGLADQPVLGIPVRQRRLKHRRSRVVQNPFSALGRLNQQAAVACERVTLMSAGLPLTLKGSA